MPILVREMHIVVETGKARMFLGSIAFLVGGLNPCFRYFIIYLTVLLWFVFLFSCILIVSHVSIINYCVTCYMLHLG